jgi:hypothetical protein
MICPKCNKNKESKEFYKDRSKKSGLDSYCKKCRAEWHLKHRKEYRKWLREWRKKNPEKVKGYYKKATEYHKKWREENPDWLKKWREKNPHKYKEYDRVYDKQYKKNHPNIIKQNRRIYKLRRRRKNIKGFHTIAEWENLKKRYNYMCLGCKRKEPEIKLTRDHIVPVIEGGTDYIDNIQPLCHNCNSQKNTKNTNYK